MAMAHNLKGFIAFCGYSEPSMKHGFFVFKTEGPAVLKIKFVLLVVYIVYMIYLSEDLNIKDMITINGTFAAIEKQLLNNGFSCVTLDRNCSVFKTEKEIAYVYFIGLGKGFEC